MNNQYQDMKKEETLKALTKLREVLLPKASPRYAMAVGHAIKTIESPG